jgi:hypothetical protein
MVFANRTYLDSLNRYIVLRYYKALLGISERSMVSTEPLSHNKHIDNLKGSMISKSNQYSRVNIRDV